MATKTRTTQQPAVTGYLLSLRDELKRAGKPLAQFIVGDLHVDVLALPGSLCAVIRRPKQGGVLLRLTHQIGEYDCKVLRAEPGEAVRLRATSAFGEHVISLCSGADAVERLRAIVRFTPAARTTATFTPRDLYPLDARDDPLGSTGMIEAVQRGLNAGFLYFHVDEPGFGNVLYLQNLTSSNDYYRATGTKPEAVVGGTWPELGYLLPTPPQEESSEPRWLEAGVEVTVSDAILVFRSETPADERDSARQFLQMVGGAYQMLELPDVEYRDWIDRAERSASDLGEAPEATIRHYGHRYIHPYTAAEYPDIMVQMSVVTALHDWGKWLGQPHPLEADFKAGLDKFYDPKLQTLRRYLPNVGSDKDADAVDSWYLYHPLLNLGVLALDGDEQARRLFLNSIDYGIRSAHHFDYEWPVQYKVTDFSIITEAAPADGRGQTDVGGIYAWVMLQAFELTDDKRFLDEARKAIDKAMGLRFDINYQANLTAWGAAACMRLWRITNERTYLDQSYVYLASFLHNAVIWDSQIGHAQHYENFLGVTCLQDAPYMAMYECFDSFVAFERYLDDGGPELEPAARMMVSEYCKYALSRAWFYYPDALPPEVIADEQRESNGHIDRKLSFPLEDLYPDGQQAGQVGQEVYGAGAAFIFATRAFHKIEGAPFLLNCDHFVRNWERLGDRALSLTLDGGETCTANLRLVRLPRRKLPKAKLMTAGQDVIRPNGKTDDRIDYHVPASGRLILTWE
jgi:hypothetical protein